MSIRNDGAKSWRWSCLACEQLTGKISIVPSPRWHTDSPCEFLAIFWTFEDGNMSFRVCLTALPHLATNRTDQKLVLCQTIGICSEEVANGVLCKSIQFSASYTPIQNRDFSNIVGHERYMDKKMNGEKRRIFNDCIKPTINYQEWWKNKSYTIRSPGSVLGETENDSVVGWL